MQNDSPKTKPCPNCGAPLPLTGTFCLECDTPVEGHTGGLSVAEVHTVRRGHPIQGIAMLIGVAAVVIGLIALLIYVTSPHDAADARKAVVNGVQQVVLAEGGHPHACIEMAKYISESAIVARPQCRALVGTDPGAHLINIQTGKVTVDNETATVHITATLVDNQGSRRIDADFPATNPTVQLGWRYAWDGKKIG